MNLERDIESELLADCDGVRLLPGLASMSNGSAVRSGVGALWVGAMSATISALSLVLVAVVIYRLPLPDTSLITAQGLKVVFGGMMGAFIVTGLAFVAPRLGPTQTFILLFLRHRG